MPYGDGFNTFLYVTSEQWVVCDTWATIAGGSPTVKRVHSLGAPLSDDQLLISQNFSRSDSDGAQYFAAGARIPGVISIQYSFPDGDEADGDTWWTQCSPMTCG